MRYRCYDCGIVDDGEAFKRAENASERHDVGGKFTDKECPECGALAYRLSAMKVRWQRRGAHIWAFMFMGEDMEHMANTGTLVLSEDEWDRFRQILLAGNDSQNFELVITEMEP